MIDFAGEEATARQAQIAAGAPSRFFPLWPASFAPAPEGANRNQSEGDKQKRPIGIEHHISKLACPCGRKTLMPLVKASDQEGARNGQTSREEACPVSKCGGEGAKP